MSPVWVTIEGAAICARSYLTGDRAPMAASEARLSRCSWCSAPTRYWVAALGRFAWFCGPKLDPGADTCGCLIALETRESKRARRRGDTLAQNPSISDAAPACKLRVASEECPRAHWARTQKRGRDGAEQVDR